MCSVVQRKKSWGSASAWIVSSSSDFPRTTGGRFPRTGLPERRKCTASNGIRVCRRNVVRRTARSDHTTGSEWRCLFATHANPSITAEAINRMSVRHLHYIYRRPSRAQHLGLARTLKPISLLGHNPNTVRITSDQCPRIQPHTFPPLCVRPLRFKSAWSQFGSTPNCMVGSGL